MYCIDTEALVFMFNGGSSYGFTILVYNNYINNEKYMRHGFLAPQAYLCSTSLSKNNIVACWRGGISIKPIDPHVTMEKP